jgi:hypothetical protein
LAQCGRFANFMCSTSRLPELRVTLQAQRIRGFPTIKFFFGGQQVHEIVGADAKGIEEAVKRLSAPQAT